MRLLDAAVELILHTGGEPPRDAIAASAGVGIGTLYRHFPSREALIEAVYRAELAEVSASAAELSGRYPPPVALRRWMDRYATFVAAKKGMAESLRTIFESGAVDHRDTKASVTGAVQILLDAGVADGSLNADVRAEDVVASLLGIFLAGGSAEQAQRMLDLLLAGIRAGAGKG